MSKNPDFRLLKTSLACACILSSLSGCVKIIDCGINGYHVHLYADSNTKLSRYINSEKEYVGSLERTDTYQTMTNELEIIDEN